MGMGSLDRFFDRLNLMSNAEIKVEKRRTVSFTVTEGDNEAIDRAIGIGKSALPADENSQDTAEVKRRSPMKNSAKISKEIMRR